MSANTNTYESMKAVILSAHECTTSREKIKFYNTWAETYDQVRNNKQEQEVLVIVFHMNAWVDGWWFVC